MKKWLSIVVCLALPLIVGAVSGIITARNVQTWYPQLNKPSFTPPNWLFGPVWSVLYLLMGVSLYWVVRRPAGPGRKKAVFAFALQLFFNFWWSILFFQFHLIGIALADILVLWVCMVWMISCFYKVSPAAANLQWPYLAWVSYATALNAAIYYLN